MTIPGDERLTDVIWQCRETGCTWTMNGFRVVALTDDRARMIARGVASHYVEAHTDLTGGRPQLLTDVELQAMAKTVDLVNLMAQVIDHGRTRIGDLDEVIHHVHAIQHAIMGQAAARAYPGMFRRLGATLTPGQTPPGPVGSRDATSPLVTP